MTKYIFVTGGVVSSLGKGITASAIGQLLKSRGLKVFMQKFDPYINVDPGTMSPYQHGEVFVTDDGAETDLDLGHYERFIDENLNKTFKCHNRKNISIGIKTRTTRRLFRCNRSSDSSHHRSNQEKTHWMLLNTHNQMLSSLKLGVQLVISNPYPF
jgi:hypothetical protein